MSKKIMKKVSIILAMTMLIGLFVGCQGEKVEQQDTTSNAGEQQSEKKEKVTLVAATINPDGSLLANALEGLAKKIEEKSDGQIEFKVFTGGQLGDASSIYQSVITGDIDMIYSDTGWFAEQHPQFDILETNYLFESKEHYESVVNTPGKLKYFEDLLIKDPGLKTLMFAGGLERDIISTYPINSIADMAGKNMRSKSVSTNMDWWTSMGSNPVPVAFNEVYTALQTGVVEGSQNSLDAMINMRFGEVAKYVARTQHNLSLGFVVMNNDKFESLDSELQSVILEAAKEVQPEYIAEAFAQADELAKKLENDFGVEFTNPDRVDMIKASRKQMEDLAKKYDIEDVMKEMLE